MDQSAQTGIEHALKLVARGIPPASACRLAGISPSTLYRAKQRRELQAKRDAELDRMATHVAAQLNQGSKP